MPYSYIEFRIESTGQWVTADQRDPDDEDGLRVIGMGRNTLSDGRIGLEILYADIPGNSWNAQRLARFAERAQELIDFRQAITDLPVDDPARISDPARPDFFWDGSDIVARSIIISDVAFSQANGLSFALTRAR